MVVVHRHLSRVVVSVGYSRQISDWGYRRKSFRARVEVSYCNWELGAVHVRAG